MKLIIWGIKGHMGDYIKKLADVDKDIQVIAGVDAVANPAENIYSSFKDLPPAADVIIDFSRPAALNDIIAYAHANKTALVLATTGYSEEDLAKINMTSKKVPVLRSSNMSLGINLLLSLVRNSAQKLDSSYDIEIVEAHHRRKIDSPSGTAEMLLKAAEDGRGRTDKIQYGRHSPDAPRQHGEIGVHSIRGGTIVGEHTVIFAGDDEIIEIKHTALSRSILAKGAMHAAKVIATFEPGLYDMSDVL